VGQVRADHRAADVRIGRRPQDPAERLFDSKGTTGTAGVVAAVAFVPVAGFFTTGTSATLPLGAGVRGYIDEDVPLAVAAAPTRAR